jgi:hypothetical protein
VGRILDHEFRKADWDQDGKISLQVGGWVRRDV